MTKSLFFLALSASLFFGAGCSGGSADGDNDRARTGKDCSKLEPQNPYPEGSGHYAGYEWAQENQPAECGGSFTSFIEGCEEYHSQMDAYEACINKD